MAQFTDIFAGGSTTCGQRADYFISCWGGKYDHSTFPAGSDVDLAANDEMICALRGDHSVVCWASDRYLDAHYNGSADSVIVAGGWKFTCNLQVGATIRCFGDLAGPPSRVLEAPEGNFVDLHAGDFHVCALRTDGVVICWGMYGIYGNGNVEDTPAFEEAPEGAFTGLAGLTYGHQEDLDFTTCALRTDAKVVCWNGRHVAPLDLLFSSLSAGAQHFCGLTMSGRVACWGDDTYGQSTPPSGQFISIVSEANYSCALQEGYSLLCWGLGFNDMPVQSERSFMQIVGSETQICALMLDGTERCWGSGNDSPYDNGIASPNEDSYTAISRGSQHACGLLPDGTAECWGDNTYGQSKPPAGHFTSIAAGSLHTCGLRPDQTVECWGIQSVLHVE